MCEFYEAYSDVYDMMSFTENLIKYIADKMNVAEVGGGGPLFGVNGIVIVGHGRSKSDSIANGILLAKRAYDVELTNLIKKAIDTV